MQMQLIAVMLLLRLAADMLLRQPALEDARARSMHMQLSTLILI